MGRKSTEPEKSNDIKREMRRSIDPDNRELQMISLAVNLAEQQLMDGSASSQVITHYLKLGTTMANLEKQRLENEVLLLQAKTEALKTSQNSESLYYEVMQSLKGYKGDSEDENN